MSDSTKGLYSPTSRDQKSGKLALEHLSAKWVEKFMSATSVMSRVQTGMLLPSAAKQKLIEREVAFYLGVLMRRFSDGSIDESNVFNADETHFVVDLDDGRTLAMKEDKNVKYSNVVSADVGMTMMVMLGGGATAHLLTPFMIFQNDGRSYPIQGVSDTVPGACYRRGPKGWMDTRVFEKWLSEKRVMQALSGGRQRILYIDSASAHRKTPTAEEALSKTNMAWMFLPKNATGVCQPADSFITQKIKLVWRRKWNEKKLEMIQNNTWADWKDGSVKRANPGKVFYLKLAVLVVREVSNARDSDGVLFCLKATMGCGMALNLNGRVEKQQLFPPLRSIVEKYPENFNGKPVSYSLSRVED